MADAPRQRVLITGSTKGIGRGLAAEFARRGHAVFVTGRAQGDVDEVVAGLDGEIRGAPCEVTRIGEVQDLWDQAARAWGGLDIWINNAGLARTTRPILDYDQGDVETMVTSNMIGTINGSRVAARGFLELGGGRLFNMLGGGSNGEYFPGMGVYGTTKRGLRYFSDALAKELKDTPVLVGQIRPGMIVTEGVVREAKDDLASFEKSRAMMNRLVDQVETVAPFLVDRILATEKTGERIAWMTPTKIMKRMLLGRFQQREDQFERFGL